MMQSNVRNQYFETEVLTATPQKLRLMLIEGAIRFANQARTATSRGDQAAAAAATDRCSSVITELLSSIKLQDEVTRRVAAVYAFALTEIAEIRQQQSEDAWDDLLAVLEIERETWHLLCDTRVALDSGKAKPAGEAAEDLEAASTAASGPFEIEA